MAKTMTTVRSSTRRSCLKLPNAPPNSPARSNVSSRLRKRVSFFEVGKLTEKQFANCVDEAGKRRTEKNFTSSMEKNMNFTEFNKEDYVYFGAGISNDIRLLSNFSDCDISGEVYVKSDKSTINEKCFSKKIFMFPSAEHFWWAHFMEREEDIARLAIGGDLSTVRSGLSLIYKGMDPSKLENKIRFWEYKNGVGFVAKLLASKDTTLKETKYTSKRVRIRAEKLGIVMSDHPLSAYGDKKSIITLASIWDNILIEKYSQNKAHMCSLLGTGDKYLVEFCKMRVPEQFWSGRVKNGVLYGRNFMGLCNMAVRDHFSI